jgi:lysophospholipase L1-like esterase
MGASGKELLMNMRTLLFFLLSASSLLARQGAQPDLRWIETPSQQLEVDGLPWHTANHGEWIRLPLQLKGVVRKEVWELAQSPSGGRIRFRSDSTSLSVKLEYPEAPGMKNMHAFGQTGVDLYVDGVYRGTAIADAEAKPGKIYTHSYFNGRPRAEHEIVLYLPLYMGVKVLAVGVDKDAVLRPAKPFALSKPVVFYGTSITQGGCASRPGMSYQAILGRRLNLDFVNLGFSGNGKGEPEMARAVADIDASCYVMDFAQNNPTVESLQEVYGPFVEIIRAKHPETPVVLVTPIYATREAWGPDPRLDGMRAHIRGIGARRIAAGDTNLQIVEGPDLLGPADGGGLVDGTHPNDLGFQWMADGLAARLRKVLGLEVTDR